MCSIGGFVANKPLAGEMANRLATALLYYGSIRGDQSSGVYVDGQLLKKAISPEEFVISNEFDGLFNHNVSACLTHTRQPTCGGVGDAQAQPFKLNSTVTVHNGFYFDTDILKTRWGILKKSGVDSELVTSFISTHGIKKLPEFIESTDGPSAIATLYNGQLYLMRSQNPIFYAHVILDNEHKLTVFASTENILRDSLSYCWLLPMGLRIKEVPEGILFSVGTTKLKQRSQKITHDDLWGLGHHGYRSETHPHWPSHRYYGSTRHRELDEDERLAEAQIDAWRTEMNINDKDKDPTVKVYPSVDAWVAENKDRIKQFSNEKTESCTTSKSDTKSSKA